jgi:two-component system response regulator FixJ
MNGDKTVYIVDDDAGVRATLQAVLEAAGFRVESFANGDSFLAAAIGSSESCVLLDVFLPDMTGLTLQEELRRRDDRLPVVMITGRADVPTAFQAMKNGAVDFIEKPFEPEDIVTMVQRAFDRRRAHEAEVSGVPAMRERIADLTDRERAILKGAIAGKSSKEIARDLSISPRTVDVHRGNVLKKLRVRSTSEAIQVLLRYGDVATMLDRPARASPSGEP